MDSREYFRLEDTYGAHNYHPLDVVIERGEGVWVWDVEGKKYMDFLSAYSALNQGHCHPRIYRVLAEQAKKLTLTSRAFRNDQLGSFCELVSRLSGLEKVLPMNTGAEAVETALKAARKWAYRVKGVETDKAEIIVCANNFHGRTITIISASTEDQYKDGFGPLTPGFKIIPFGDIDALKETISKNTAAFLVEPIQGEGGIIIPPAGYLKKAEQICRKQNVLLITDEIQTGLGRTGKLFAFQHNEVQPDGIIVGKALSGGYYPVSAFISTAEVMDVFTPGDHGSTFGGNPLAAAIAKEALRILIDENLADKANESGNYLMDKLRSIKSPHIKEIRGKGLMIGIELKPEAGGARRFCEQLQELGLLAKETHQHVIRLAPPLIIEKSELDLAIDYLKQVLAA